MSVLPVDSPTDAAARDIDKVALCENISKLSSEAVPGIIALVQEREPHVIDRANDSFEFDLAQLRPDTLLVISEYVNRCLGAKTDVGLPPAAPPSLLLTSASSGKSGSRAGGGSQQFPPPPLPFSDAPSLKRGRSKSNTGAPPPKLTRRATDTLPVFVPTDLPPLAPTLSGISNMSFALTPLESDSSWLPPITGPPSSITPSLSSFLPLVSIDSSINDLPAANPMLFPTISSIDVQTECANMWNCAWCSLDNPESATTCTLCSRPRPSLSRGKSTTRYNVIFNIVKKNEGGEGEGGAGDEKTVAPQLPTASPPQKPAAAAPAQSARTPAPVPGKAKAPYPIVRTQSGGTALAVPHLKRGGHGATVDPTAPKAALPYACEWPGCGKSFGYRSNLYVHLRTHTNEMR